MENLDVINSQMTFEIKPIQFDIFPNYIGQVI